jgi:hypothetical protein
VDRLAAEEELMHLRTLLALLLAVAVLAAVLWRSDDGGGVALAADRPLFAGLEGRRITRLEVEYRDQALRLVLQRDPQGAWSLLEPQAFRALDGLLGQLSDTAARARAEPAPGVEPAAVGLDAPQLQLTFTETLGADEQRTHTLALGDTDLDGLRVFALQGGEVVRVPRSFLSLVDLPPAEWRDKRLVGVSRADVVAFTRRGSLPDESGAFDPQYAGELDLELALTEDGWWSSAPWRARLEPGAVDPLRLVLAALSGRDVLSDDPQDRARYGLDPEAFRYEVRLRDGTEVVLRFGRRPGSDFGDSRWSVCRDGLDTIYSVLEADVRLLTRPAEALLDYDLLDLVATDVERFAVRWDLQGLSFERVSGRWWVRASDADPTRAVPADPGAVGDWLGQWVRAEVVRFRSPASLGEGPLERGEALFERQDGSQLRLQLAAPPADAGDVPYLVRRADEDLWGEPLEDLVARATVDPREFESRAVAALSELDLGSIAVDDGKTVRRWIRDADRGLWSLEGASAEDRAFALLVEGLLDLRVEAWLPGAQEAPLADRLRVTVVDRRGTVLEYELGRLEHGGERRTVVRSGGRTGLGPERVLAGLELHLRR